MSYRVEKWNRDSAPAASELKQIMLGEGYSVFQWTDAPGAIYGDHMHNDDQTHWIVTGMLELNVDKIGVVVLGPGDRDFMPAGTIHSARTVGNRPVSYLIGRK